ncbi:portal protein [Mycobacterium phage Gravaillia]|nr:portal protein [Mycobacterium phage Gravaillia]
MTERVKTAAPVSEAGYVFGSGVVDGWTVWDPFEQTPELQWPQSVAVYSRMDNEDSRVTSLLEAISLPIRSTPWRIRANGASDEVTEFVSRNLMVPIDGEDDVRNPGRSRGRFSWAEHLEEVTSPTLQFGHAVFEQVYRPRNQSPDGRFWLRKLAPRPQWTISKFNVAPDGGLESIEQIAPPARARGSLYVANIAPPEIPVNRLVVYTRNKRPGQWQGKSILRSAYKHWLLKDKLLRIEAATAERNGMGIPVGTASSATDEDEVRKMAALARSVRGGINAGVGLAQGQILELLGVSGNLPDIRRAIEGHDRSIALSGLAHFLNLDGKGGSYALASVLEDPFTQAVHAYATSICRIANQHIIEDLVDINFGVDTSAPVLTFDPIGSRQDLTAAAVKMLFDAGVFDDDPAVKRAIRQRFNLPSELNDTPSAEPEEPAAVPNQSAAPARTRSSGSADARARAPKADQGVLFDA